MVRAQAVAVWVGGEWAEGEPLEGGDDPFHQGAGHVGVDVHQRGHLTFT